jgi:carbamoylphosphate synthase small subunit
MRSRMRISEGTFYQRPQNSPSFLWSSNFLSYNSSCWSTKFREKMPAQDLIDHSPQHPSAAAPLANASNLVLIDNYDSFTWNVYQYLVLQGATVTVHRNDKVTLEELIAQKPTQLVISPGPGHPETDSGVSREAIQHFAGKIPIFGVCMGEYVPQVTA